MTGTEGVREELTDGAMRPGKAAEFSGFSKTALYAAMADKSLPYYRRGGRGRLIAKRDLLAWMSKQLAKQ